MKYLLLIFFALPLSAQTKSDARPPLNDKDSALVFKTILASQNAASAARAAQDNLQQVIADVKLRNHCVDLTQDNQGNIQCIQLPTVKK